MKNDTMAWLKGRRLLLVEDDFLLAECLKEALEDQGAIVLGPAPSVDRALRLLDEVQHAIDAAILDVNLRGEVVFSVADTLVERGLPFIFVSGYDRELVPARFSNIRHCIKPVDVRSVCTALQDC